MEEKKYHSPLPWRVTNDHDAAIVDADGKPVGECHGCNDADLIVEAVNAYHDVTKCNGFKLREALREMLAEFDRISARWGSTRICRILDNAQDALSAPARNCDRFATKQEAWDAFGHEYFGPTDPGFIESAFERWLFEKEEEEKEGG